MEDSGLGLEEGKLVLRPGSAQHFPMLLPAAQTLCLVSDILEALPWTWLEETWTLSSGQDPNKQQQMASLY